MWSDVVREDIRNGNKDYLPKTFQNKLADCRKNLFSLLEVQRTAKLIADLEAELLQGAEIPTCLRYKLLKLKNIISARLGV